MVQYIVVSEAYVAASPACTSGGRFWEVLLLLADNTDRSS